MKRGEWGIKRVKELGNNKFMDWSIKHVELVVSYLKEVFLLGRWGLENY